MMLEALVAILIFSFGILALVGLQSNAVRQSTDAKFRSNASYLANRCLAQMWVADRSQIAKSCEDSNDLSPDLPKPSSRTVTTVGDVASGYTATVTIHWQMPGESTTHEHKVVTIIHGRCDTQDCS
jgi:type IV pilus assembly protein PilV